MGWVKSAPSARESALRAAIGKQCVFFPYGTSPKIGVIKSVSKQYAVVVRERSECRVRHSSIVALGGGNVLAHALKDFEDRENESERLRKQHWEYSEQSMCKLIDYYKHTFDGDVT